MSELSFGDFRGGLWLPDEAATLEEQAGFNVPANALLRADNLDYLPSGGIRGRRGSMLYSGTPLGGPVVMLTKYYGRFIPQTPAFGKPFGRQLDGVGTVRWTNPAAIQSPFGEQAAATLLGGSQTIYLVALAPFFHDPLPASALITGITVKVAAFGGPDAYMPREASITLLSDGVAIGDDKSSGAAVAGSLQSTSYGNNSDLWGHAWTADEINSPGFGAAVSFEDGGGAGVVMVDYIAIYVAYSAGEEDAFIAAHTSGDDLVYSRGTGAAFEAIDGGTLTNPTVRPRAIPWPQKGKIFLFDGTNPVSEYDGVRINTVTAEDVDGTVLDPPRRGPYACLHKNRLYATDPGELASSVYACDINNERSWRPVIQLAANDSRGGILTGLESFGDSLVILKDTSIFRFLGDPEFSGNLAQVSDVGCVAPDTVQVTPWGVIFLGRDGLWLYDGDSITSLTASLRPLFSARTEETVYRNAVGVYYPRREQYWLRLDPTDLEGDGYVLHRVAQASSEGEGGQFLAWSRIPSLRMNAGTVQLGRVDQGELYLGDTAGYVWKRDVGALDFALTYTTEIVTAQRMMTRNRQLARAARVRPMYRGRNSLPVGLRYDQVDTDTITANIGTAGGDVVIQEPRRYITERSSFGRFVSVSAASTEGPDFELYRIDLSIQPRGLRVWR